MRKSLIALIAAAVCWLAASRQSKAPMTAARAVNANAKRPRASAEIVSTASIKTAAIIRDGAV